MSTDPPTPSAAPKNSTTGTDKGIKVGPKVGGAVALASGNGDGDRLQRHLFESQLESSVDGILAVGTQGEVLWNNGRFVEIWGLPPGVIDARSDEELVRA